jgi:hypothetical protein
VRKRYSIFAGWDLVLHRWISPQQLYDGAMTAVVMMMMVGMMMMMIIIQFFIIYVLSQQPQGQLQ